MEDCPPCTKLCFKYNMLEDNVIDMKEHFKVKHCNSVPTKEFADVTFACRGDQFHAHKMILTSNSIKFQYELSKVSKIYLTNLFELFSWKGSWGVGK